MKQQGNHCKACIFDFDSTIVSIETLDFLLTNFTETNDQDIEKITNRAMNGELSFRTSLQMRLENARVMRSHIVKMQSTVCEYITKNAEACLQALQKECDIYIVSGGFLEIIHPIANKISISQQNCFANEFIYENDKVVGFNKENPLSESGGKIKVVQHIMQTNNYKQTFMIGDGYTDLEVFKAIPSVIFCGFGEHVTRKVVLDEAKNFFYNFQDLTSFILQS